MNGADAGESLPDSPYKGLAPFDDSELDARFFFGRERETELVAANLMASRLTILYGPSGVGKSSLLRAGVARRLRALVGAGGPEDRDVAVIVDGWRDEPVGTIAGAVAGRSLDAGERLADVLAEHLAETGGELYLILDQMEEYFLYHGRDGGGTLADELAETLSRPELRVHVLLGIRDDSLSELDAFKGSMPGLFSNVLRLDHLDRRSARSAIVGPLAAYVALGGAEVVAEPAFVEAVLDQVATGRIEQGLAGRGAVENESDPTRVEAPYLQLVLERLWEVERTRGSAVLRADTLAELGGSDRIVEEHLERALAPLDPDGRELAARLFNHLVTPSGTKIAHSAADLARYARDENGRLEGVLHDLAGARIVRPLPARNGAGPRYEIFHDVLAEAVLEWRTRHETEQILTAERGEARRRHRRLAVVAGASLLALALTVAFAVYAFSERARANDRARTAKARELTVASLSEGVEDPELSVLLALEAVRRDPSGTGEDALRSAFLADHARRTIVTGTPLLAAALRGDRMQTVADDDRITAAAYGAGGRTSARSEGRRVEVFAGGGGPSLRFEVAAPVVRLALGGGLVGLAAADGAVVVVDRSGASRFRTKLPNRPTALALSPDGSRVAAASGKITRVFDVQSGRRLALLESRSTSLAIDISPDRDLLATGGADGAVRLWDIPHGRLANVFGGHTNQVRAVRFTPDGTRLISAADDATGRVWRVEDGHVFAVLAGHHDEIASVTVTPDGGRAVTASADGTARIWSVLGDPELRVVARVPGDPPVVDRVDDTSVFVRTGSTTLRLNRRTGAVLERTRAEPPAASVPGWRVEIAGPLVRLTRPGGRVIELRGHEDDVTSVRLSPDGATLLTASADHDVRLWRAADGAPVRLLKAHGGRVADARFSPDGRWIVTAGPGVAVWSARTGSRPLFYLRGHDGPLTAAAFAPDSRTIVTSGEDGTVRTYLCQVCGPLDELVALAKRRLGDAGRTLTPDERRTYLGD